MANSRDRPQWLAADERVYLRTHPHWKWLLKPVAIFLLSSVVLGFLLYFVNTRLTGTTSMVVGIGVVCVYVAIILMFSVVKYIEWVSSNFYVTNKRVTYRHGVFTRQGIDIPLTRISSVEFRHNIVDRVLRTGALVIESASDEPLLFDDIPNVEKVHAMLYREVLDLDGTIT